MNGTISNKFMLQRPFATRLMTLSPTVKITSILPNLLTLMRLLASGIVVWMVNHNHLREALLVFCVAAFTDWLDGFLARHWQVDSFIGRLFDPIADKVLMASTYICLATNGYLPFWMVIIILIRDAGIIIGGILALIGKIPLNFTPLKISKVNTFLQILLVGIILGTNQSTSLFLYHVLWISIYITAITTVWSAVAYGWIFSQQAIRWRNT